MRLVARLEWIFFLNFPHCLSHQISAKFSAFNIAYLSRLRYHFVCVRESSRFCVHKLIGKMVFGLLAQPFPHFNLAQ